MNALNRYKSMSVQAKSAIWFTFCGILQKGISFLTVPIFTRLLTTEEYGTYSLYLSWFQILTIITSLYLYYGVFNNAMVKYENDRDRYISSMQGLIILICTICFSVYLLFQNMWTQVLGLAPVFMYFMFVEMLVAPAISFWSGKQRFEYKYKKLVIVTIGKSLTNPVLGFLMVMLLRDKAIGRVFSVVLCEVIFSGIIMIIQFARGKCLIDKIYWKYALAMAIPLLPHYLAGMVLNQGDRIMIEKLIGTSEVAFYSVAYNIGMLVQVFTNGISNSLTPWLYQKNKAKEYDGVAKVNDFLLLIILLLAVCLMLCSPEIVMIFGSASYRSAMYVIPPVAASVFFIFLYSIITFPQFYYEKTQYMLASSIMSAMLNIVLNYFFIKAFGYIAAGYTTLVCNVLYCFGHYQISKRILIKNNPDLRLYTGKYLAIMSSIVITSGVLCNYLFEYIVVRYLILVVIAIGVFLKREKMFAMIKQVKS